MPMPKDYTWPDGICWVQVGDEYLDMEHRYTMVTKAYLGKGKDGYDSLAKAEVNLSILTSNELLK